MRHIDLLLRISDPSAVEINMSPPAAQAAKYQKNLLSLRIEIGRRFKPRPVGANFVGKVAL